jgi:hypothetical protein
MFGIHSSILADETLGREEDVVMDSFPLNKCIVVAITSNREISRSCKNSSLYQALNLCSEKFRKHYITEHLWKKIANCPQKRGEM